MDSIEVLPDPPIIGESPMVNEFARRGIASFQQACRFVLELPYGYNSDRDEKLSLFRENQGTCTTKHAVIAALAGELNLPVHKNLGLYPMTEELVAGAGKLLVKFALPYIPMLHCFITFAGFRIDLTEGNRNGKKRSIEEYLCVWQVQPDISEKEEYLLLRKALQETILKRAEFSGVDLKRILQAREQGLKLLNANIL